MAETTLLLLTIIVAILSKVLNILGSMPVCYRKRWLYLFLTPFILDVRGKGLAGACRPSSLPGVDTKCESMFDAVQDTS